MVRLLYFTAPWCATCHAVKPALIAKARAAGVPVEYVDVAYHEGMLEANRYGVHSLPALIELNDGKPKRSFTGTGVLRWEP